MIHVLLIIMAVYFATLGAINVFIFNDFDLAVLDMIGMAGTWLLLACFQRRANLNVTSWAVVLIPTAIILIFIHITSGLAYAVIWVTILPPISFFLLGRQSGAWVCAGVFSYVVAFFSTQLPTAQPAVPEPSSLMNIAEVLLAHWFLCRFYERSRAAAHTELERLSETDKLPGLYNRRHLDILLTREFDVHKRTDAPLRLILCDIDHFKRINDKFGHLTGRSRCEHFQIAKRTQPTTLL
jgi:diguanylate cyclase